MNIPINHNKPRGNIFGSYVGGTFDGTGFPSSLTSSNGSASSSLISSSFTSSMSSGGNMSGSYFSSSISSNGSIPRSTRRDCGDKPHFHNRPMSWEDVGEFTRLSYSSDAEFSEDLMGSPSSVQQHNKSPMVIIPSSDHHHPIFERTNNFSPSNFLFDRNQHDNDNQDISLGKIDNMMRSVVGKVLSDVDETVDDKNQFHRQQPLLIYQNVPGLIGYNRNAQPSNFQTTDQFESVTEDDTTLNQQHSQSKKLCKYYLSGEGCKFGDNCSFLHPNDPTQNQTPTYHVDTSLQSSSFTHHHYSDHYHQPNTFNNGHFINSPSHSNGAFFHQYCQPSTEQPTSSSPPNNRNLQDGELLRSTVSNNSDNTFTPQQQICQFFKKGECKFGDKCRNIHIKKKSKLDEQTRKKLKGIRCRFGINCPFGAECYYYHSDADFEQ